MEDSGPHISIKAEPVITFGNIVLSNSLITSFIILIGFTLLSYFFYKQSRLPSRSRTQAFFFIYFINRSLYNFLSSIVGKKIGVVYAFAGAIFFYILIQNWFGLLPGVGSVVIKGGEHHHAVPLLRGGTADLNTTLALGIAAVFMVQYYGIRFLGAKKYVSKFINFSHPISFFVGILEVVSEASRVVSFSFRLFGNIFAGEVLLVVIAFLVPVLASFPFLILEVFVGFIQALIFALLTAVFINSAAAPSH